MLQDRTWLSLIGFTAGVVVSVANVLQFLGGEAAGKQLTPCTTPTAQLLIIRELDSVHSVLQSIGGMATGKRQRRFGGPCRHFAAGDKLPLQFG